MRLHLALLPAALLLLGAAPALAQNPPSGGGRGRGGRMQMLFRGITLSAEQQAQIDSIRARYRAELPAREPGSRPDSAARQQMRELFRRQQGEVRAVLTADQQTIFDRNVAELRQRRPGGP